MENAINWFEIPVSDFSRAQKFYSAILEIEIQPAEMFGNKMGFLPSDKTNVSGAIVQGAGYEPSQSGSLVYLNGGKDLQHVLNRVEKNKGKVVVPKTAIGPDMGFFAVFIDSEGNKIGLHSIS